MRTYKSAVAAGNYLSVPGYEFSLTQESYTTVDGSTEIAWKLGMRSVYGIRTEVRVSWDTILNLKLFLGDVIDREERDGDF